MRDVTYTPWQWAAMATLATLVLFLLHLLVISTLLPSGEPLLPPLEEVAELAPWQEGLHQLAGRLEGLEAASRVAGGLEARSRHGGPDNSSWRHKCLLTMARLVLTRTAPSDKKYSC